MSANPQTAYDAGHVGDSGDVDHDVFLATKLYLSEDLGLPESDAVNRAEIELERRIPKSIIRMLASKGLSVEGKAVLDLGAGLGGMSEELAVNGAHVHSLEPGANWANLTRRRVERHGKSVQVLHAFGEKIPLPDASVDMVVSLQVLEHVSKPDQVLSEALRVLRPGGHFFLACENYLAFWEPHYRLPWLPLMPKPLGVLYLKLIGRPPQFLKEAITYVTFPGVVRSCRRLGFTRVRDEELAASLARSQGIKWRVLRLLGRLLGRRVPLFLDDLRHYFRVGIYELLRKPTS